MGGSCVTVLSEFHPRPWACVFEVHVDLSSSFEAVDLKCASISFELEEVDLVPCMCVSSSFEVELEGD